MNDSSTTAGGTTHCPVCGRALDAARLQGLCPSCTWRSLNEVESEELEAPPPGSAGVSLFPVPGHLVMEEIARGGMGVVYRARQLEPDREVALKMLLPQPLGSTEMAERFRLEAGTLAELDHPAILPVYQSGRADGLPYFTMKLAGGGTLAGRKTSFAGDWPAVAELLVTLAEAVQYAHERGVLHRDLKPGNVLFDETGRPYVSDFGLAKITVGDDSMPSLTQSSRLLGTPQYLAPEIAVTSVRNATIASDVYALGAILYELLTGRPPHEGGSLAALIRTIGERDPEAPSRLTPGVPRDLEVICLTCLAREPARRYGSARELAEDLRRFLEGRPINARPVTVTERLVRWSRRNPALAGVSALLFAALLIGGTLQTRSNRRLRTALDESRLALHESLLTQARLKRSSGRQGQRYDALDLISKSAAFLGRGSRSEAGRVAGPVEPGPDEDRLLALRTEAAGALALPDLLGLDRWPVTVKHFEGGIELFDDFSHYVMVSPEGGGSLYRTADHQKVRQFSGSTNNLPVDFRFSPDRRWLATMFEDGRAEVRPIDGGDATVKFKGDSLSRTSVEFLPDSDRIAVTGNQMGAFIQNLKDGTRREYVSPPQSAGSLAIDARGERIAMYAGDSTRVFRVSDGMPIFVHPRTNGVSRLAWSPDGRLLAIANGDPPFDVSIIEVESGGEIARFEENDTAISRMTFQRDGRSLFMAGWEDRLFWWPFAGGGASLSMPAGPRLLHLSADGRRLAYEPTRGQAGVLEVTSSEVFREWLSEAPVDEVSFTIRFSPDGHLLATTGRNTVRVWDVVRRRLVLTLPLPLTAWWVTAFFDWEGKSLIYSAVGLGVVRAWIERSTNSVSGEAAFRISDSKRLADGQNFLVQELSPDGRGLVVLESRQNWNSEPAPPTAWLWPDFNPGQARKLAEGVPASGYRIIPGGKWGTSTHWREPELWLWDPATARRVRGLGIPTPVSSEPSPDGRWLVTGTADQFVVWDTASWQPVSRWQALPGNRDSWYVAVSPDSRLFAWADSVGSIHLRSLPGGRELIALPPPRRTRLRALDFAPDGGRLVAMRVDGRVYEWNLEALRRELSRMGLDWD